PEQASGASDVSSGADIYSLGVILYEMLTGSLPILRDTHIQTLIAIPVDEPASLKGIRAEVPRDLEAICLKCLAKMPRERYASAFELAEDIRRWLDGRLVRARRASVLERASKWCRRNPALALAIVALFAGLAVTIFQWRRAVHENQRADRHLDLSQQVIDDMVGRVAADSTLPRELRLSMAGRAVELQRTLLAEQPDDLSVISQTAMALYRQSQVQADLLDFENALKSVDDALFVVEPFEGSADTAELSIRLTDHRIGVLRSLDRIEEAHVAIEEQDQNAFQNDSQRAANLFQSGMLKLRNEADLEGAISDFEASIELYLDLSVESAHGFEYEIGVSELYCGTAEMYLDNLSEARRRLESAIILFNSLLEHSPGSSAVVDRLATAHLQSGRVLHGELRLEGLPVANDLPLLADCREHFDSAAAFLKQAMELNDTIQGAYGRLAVVYEMRVKLETEQCSEDCGVSVTEAYAGMFEDVPDENPSRRIIGRVLGESYLRVCRALIETGDEEGATEQLDHCEQLISLLSETYPGVEEIESVREQCSTLRNQITN
ncbi:MAG: hypothetical protein AAF456_23035, partial [Planctomycetota bacterium]